MDRSDQLACWPFHTGPKQGNTHYPSQNLFAFARILVTATNSFAPLAGSRCKQSNCLQLITYFYLNVPDKGSKLSQKRNKFF